MWNINSGFVLRYWQIFVCLFMILRLENNDWIIISYLWLIKHRGQCGVRFIHWWITFWRIIFLVSIHFWKTVIQIDIYYYIYLWHFFILILLNLLKQYLYSKCTDTGYFSRGNSRNNFACQGSPRHFCFWQFYYMNLMSLKFPGVV